MNNSKILIVEDEVLIAEFIKKQLLSFGFTQIFLAHNKSIAIQAIDHLKPDLVLLDLHLQGPVDGIEIAKLIDQNIHTPYVFITANADMLIIQEAIHTKALAYITKPIKKSDLFAAVQISLKSKIQSEEPFLAFKDNNCVVKVLIHEIVYIESNGNYINIFAKDQKQIARHSLEWAEEQLPVHLFMRIHRSYIVNKGFIQRSNSKSVFIGDLEIPISRTYLPKMQEYLKIV